MNRLFIRSGRSFSAVGLPTVDKERAGLIFSATTSSQESFLEE
jgi:hypothetical protein